MYEGRFRVATRLPEARERLLGAVAEIDRHETVPVEAAACSRPAIAALAGTEPRPIPEREATLSGKLASEPGIRSFARVRFVDDETVKPIRTGGAGVLSSVTRADGWVVVPESAEGIATGERVTVELWESC